MKNTVGQGKLWVYSSAFVMSFNGGYINAISLVSLLKNAVGYVTGNLTSMGESIEQGQLGLCIHLLVLVLCFLLGSIVSGLVVRGQYFKIDRRYTTILVLQLVVVATAAVLLHAGMHQTGYLLALVMGVQNAMTTHYGAALIRTTHMTGTTTDLGILIAHWIKGYDVPFWKMVLYLSLIVGFLSGAVLGPLVYAHFHAWALLGCILLYGYMIILPYFLVSADSSEN